MPGAAPDAMTKPQTERASDPQGSAKPQQGVPGDARERARVKALGDDPAIGGRNRSREAATAHRVEQVTGQRLERFHPEPGRGQKGDWVHRPTDTIYDGCSPPPSQHFDRQWSNGNYQASIKGHLDHRPPIDKVVVDTTELGLTSQQTAKLREYLNGLSATDQARIMRIGF